MDKNIAEQLNKAYEAFRQACMDRDSAAKEFKLKSESYEKQIHEQQKQIDLLMSIVAKLKTQLSSMSANRVNACSQLPVPEDGEARRNGTLPNVESDQLHEKLRLALQREKFLKEQLESESGKLKQTEEESNLKEKKFESIITVKEDEIRNLKKQLKEINEAFEKETRSEKHALSRQELSPGAFTAAVYERDELETVFWGMKEEFYRLRTLARAQTDQLSKFNLQREPVTEIPFSKPIQCTDEQADDLCNPWVKKEINRDVPHFPQVTARGMGQEEEENSVESLSKFNVKFPPTDHDVTFLESTPDTSPIVCTVGTGNLLQDQQFNQDLGDQAANFSEMKHNLFEECGTDPSTSAMHNLPSACMIKPPAHTNTIQSPLENAFLYKEYIPKVFSNQDVLEINFPPLETNERTGVPQQPLWNSLARPSADSELDQPEICEFCQQMFPPSHTSREDFLRHLNSHFNLKS